MPLENISIQEMQEKLKKLLERNRADLVDNIDSENGFINYLESKGILNKRLAVTISRHQDPFKKNEAILDALHKRPDKDFFSFCQALNETNQSHIVEKYLNTDLSAPAALAVPRDADTTFKKLGVEMRGVKSEADLVKTMQNCSMRQLDHSNSHTKIEMQNGETGVQGNHVLPEGPKLLGLDEIVVQQCDRNFYNSNKQLSYQMNKHCRGKCVVLNIYDTLGQEPRQGAEVDEKILLKLFMDLHFDVILHRNLTSQDILKSLYEITSDPKLNSDQSFVLFVMSHGTIQIHDGHRTGVIFGSDGKPIPISEILVPIAECQALSGKPKLVIFQACRGDYYDETDSVKDSEELIDTTETDACPPGLVRFEDFIIGFPTQSGFRSFRNTKNGSWFINAIVQVFMKEACVMDVSAMLRKCNGMVSKWIPRTTDPRMQQKGQVASISDSLTKSYLYLFPGITEGKEIS